MGWQCKTWRCYTCEVCWYARRTPTQLRKDDAVLEAAWETLWTCKASGDELGYHGVRPHKWWQGAFATASSTGANVATCHSSTSTSGGNARSRLVVDEQLVGLPSSKAH